MDLRRRFGGYIRRLRTRRYLTQVELAGRSGISVDGLRRVESGVGSPSLDTLAKLSLGLGISLTSLFAGLEADRSLPLAAELLEFLDGMSEVERRKALLWIMTEFAVR